MIYMDNAATTMTAPEVVNAMLPYFTEKYGNPSSLYRPGNDSKCAVLKARENVAELIGAKESEIFFTSGGSESDNWALRGACESFITKFYSSSKQAAQAAKDESGKLCRIGIITTRIEHHAVLNTCKYLEKLYTNQGAMGVDLQVKYLPVDNTGVVRPEILKEALESFSCDFVLVSIMLANNEIGTIEPIGELARLAHSYGALFHTDAVQGVGNIPVDVKALGIDMLSASGHKFGGPKGIGFLYIKQATEIASFINGGSQQNGRRAGTENVPAIVGLGKAAELYKENMRDRVTYVEELRNKMISQLQELIPDISINGQVGFSQGDSFGEGALPGCISVSFNGIEASSLLIRLDMKGICVSAGSACAAGSLEPSHVLQAIGLSEEAMRGTVRISLSHRNTMEEIDAVAKELRTQVLALRSLRTC